MVATFQVLNGSPLMEKLVSKIVRDTLTIAHGSSWYQLFVGQKIPRQKTNRLVVMAHRGQQNWFQNWEQGWLTAATRTGIEYKKKEGPKSLPCSLTTLTFFYVLVKLSSFPKQKGFVLSHPALEHYMEMHELIFLFIVDEHAVGTFWRMHGVFIPRFCIFNYMHFKSVFHVLSFWLWGGRSPPVFLPLPASYTT